MKIISNIELPTLTPGAVRVGSSDQIDQYSQSFHHSLLALMNLPSKAGTTKRDVPKTARQRGSMIEDEKPSAEVPARLVQQSLILPQQTALPHQGAPAQQSIPAVTPVTPTLGAFVASSDSSVIVAQAIEFGNNVLPGLPISSGVNRRVEVLTDPLSTVTNFVSHTLPDSASNEFAVPSPFLATSSRPGKLQNSLSKSDQTTVLSAPFSSIQNGDSMATTPGIKNSLPSMVLDSSTSKMPDSLSKTSVDSSLDAASTNTSNAAPSANRNDSVSSIEAESQNVLPKVLQDAFLGVVRNAYSNAGAATNPAPAEFKNSLPQEARITFETPSGAHETHIILPVVLPSIPRFSSDDLAAMATNVRADSDPNSVSSTLPKDLSSTAQSLATPVAMNAVLDAQLGANPVPVLGAAGVTVDGDVALKASHIPADHGIPPSASDEQAISAVSISVPGASSELLVATTQLRGGVLKLGKAGLSNLIPATLTKASAKSATNGKDASKGATNDADQKQPPLSVSPKSDLQEIAQSSDQSRGYTSSQGQSAASDQTSLTDHSVAAVAHSQAPTLIASPVQNTTTVAGSSEQRNMVAGNLPYASTAFQQAPPVINTAKLIQSIGQSEMRVGMRSNEFGNISINTSTNRGLISAQISLDHSELARTLAAHLPEIQARLGGNEAVDVRIDTNGSRAGQGAGMAGSMSNDSSDHSRDGRQQPESTSFSYLGNGFVARSASTIAAAATTGDGRLSARLDVRF